MVKQLANENNRNFLKITIKVNFIWTSDLGCMGTSHVFQPSLNSDNLCDFLCALLDNKMPFQLSE